MDTRLTVDVEAWWRACAKTGPTRGRGQPTPPPPQAPCATLTAAQGAEPRSALATDASPISASRIRADPWVNASVRPPPPGGASDAGALPELLSHAPHWPCATPPQ